MAGQLGWKVGTCATFVKWTRWTLSMAVPWWQHSRRCHSYQKVKSFPSYKARRSALISVSFPPARHQFTLPDHGYGASASRGVPVYVPAFAGTHCAYPRRDGQAELTCVAGYILRRFSRLQTVTHPSTNRARRRLTSLMWPTTLPTKPNR